MTEVLDVVNGFPAPLKMAWALWLAWGASQLVWYRRGRVAVVKALPAPRPRPRRPVQPSAPAADAVAPPQDASADAAPLDSRVA